MKKKILSFTAIFTLCLSINIAAQTGISITDEVYSEDTSLIASSIQRTADNNLIIAGTIRSSENELQPYILKTDGAGNIIWKQHLLFTQNIVNLQVLNDGNLLLLGKNMVIKLNQVDGSEIWRDSISGSMFFADVVENNENEIFITGSISLGTTFYPYLLKYTGEGELVWLKYFSRLPGDPVNLRFGFSNAIELTLDNSIIIAGFCTNLTKDAVFSPLVLKIDPDTGILLNHYNEDKWIEIYSVRNTDDGFLLAGNKNISNSTSTTPETRENDLSIIKLDNNLDFVWEKDYSFTETSNEYLFNYCSDCLQKTGDEEGFILAGTIKEQDREDTDVYVIRIDPDGNIEWEKIIGDTNNESIDAVLPVDNGKTLVLNTTQAPGENSNIWLTSFNEHVTIFSEDFEAESLEDLDLDVDPARSLLVADPDNQINHILRLRRGAWLSKNLSSDGYEDLKISFRLNAELILMHFGTSTIQENIEILWYDGTQWLSLAVIEESSDYLKYYEFDLPEEAYNNENFQFKININTLNASGFSEIDDITISGVAIEAEEPSVLYGDVNSDGIIDMTDVILMCEYLNGAPLSGPFDPIAADIDRNGIIDFDDIVMIAAIVTG